MAQAPAASGHESKLGSVWDPSVRVSAPGSDTPLSRAARLRAALLGLAISLLALALAGAGALLIAAAVFDTSIGSLG